MSGATAICRLQPGDVAAYRAMMHLFAEVFEDAESYASAPPDDGYIADLLADPTVFMLAAMQGEAMVGALVAYELRKFEQARSEVYIYDLAVAGHCRRAGIATALIAHLKPIAAARGAWVIFVQADLDDAPAVALYEKLGRREDVLHFDIDVAD